MYNVKDEEEEEVLFHNESITHSNDHVFLDNGTKCNLEHDIQTRFYVNGCAIGMTTSWPLDQMKALHSMENNSKLRNICSSYGTIGYLRNYYKEDSVTKGILVVKNNTIKGDPIRGLFNDEQMGKEQWALESNEHGEYKGITYCKTRRKVQGPNKIGSNSKL